MGTIAFNNISNLSLFDINTGEKISIGDINNIGFKSIKDEDSSIYDFSIGKEVSFSCNNLILFKEDLSKLYYMKIHAKSKRLKKKYNKLYNTRYKELMNKIFGV